MENYANSCSKELLARIELIEETIDEIRDVLKEISPSSDMFYMWDERE